MHALIIDHDSTRTQAPNDLFLARPREKIPAHTLPHRYLTIGSRRDYISLAAPFAAEKVVPVKLAMTQIADHGWKIVLPKKMCTCAQCGALYRQLQTSGRTEDLLPFLAQQAACTGEETSVTDPDGATMEFKVAPIATAPGLGWSWESGAGYTDVWHAPESGPAYADLLELDLGEAN